MTKSAPSQSKAARWSITAAGDWGSGFFIKLALMALINALGLYGLYTAWQVHSTAIIVVLGLLLLIANICYFRRRLIPAKYLYPGMVFLLVFQVFVMGYTAAVSFTNYGQGHLVTKQTAIEQNLAQVQQKVPEASNYQITVMTRDNQLYFGIVQDGQALIGSNDQPLKPLDNASIDGAIITAASGYQIQSGIAELLQIQTALIELRVPLSDNPADGTLRSDNGQIAEVWRSTLAYDATTDTMTNRDTGQVYQDRGDGQFQAADGSKLPVGWRAGVGLRNYLKLFTNSDIAKPLAAVALWTVIFASLSVATTFFLGLLLALVFNHSDLRGRRIYRVLLILPYAFPGFMSALLWKGMLNQSYGVINTLIGADIPWLSNDWLARLAVIGVNLWLGYPYMFLVTTGALQSIPSDMMESARVDGASPFRQFRSITLPLLFISVAPLLISSFAFNFNNFNLIFMLTGGGPVHGSDISQPGATDIMISMVYRVSGVNIGTPDYGLAAALSLLIFVIVGAIAAWSFKQTRKLEEMV